jgi:hypothetical protein
VIATCPDGSTVPIPAASSTKLNGAFALVRLKRSRQWLLIKKCDEFATEYDITRDDRPMKSGRRLADG